jgi:hypothetical protein
LGADFRSAVTRSCKVYQRFHGRLPNLLNPGTFTEKQLLFKFFAPIPLHSPSDKLGSRAYLPEKLKDSVHTPDLIWSSNGAAAPHNTQIPAGRYWFKSNHSSGRNIPVNYPLDDATRNNLNTSAANWMTGVHDRHRALWWYETFDRQVYLEEDISSDGFSANDWKFFVCNGRVALYQYDQDRFGSHGQTLYTRDGNYIAEELYYAGSRITPPPPQLKHMVNIAEAIGASFDFIRVDLFLHQNRVYLGEIGLVPNGCSISIRSPIIDHNLGELWFASWLGSDAEKNWYFYDTTYARSLFDLSPIELPHAESIWAQKNQSNSPK